MAHVSHTVKDWQRNSDQLPDYKPRALSNSTISILVVKPQHLGTSLAVQGLGLPASTAGGLRSTPGQGTKIPLPHGTSKKKNQDSTRLPWPHQKHGTLHPVGHIPLYFND